MKTDTVQQHIYVAGIGAANLDALWQSNAAINLRDSNPARRFDSVGGVARNICENIARLGVDVSMLSLVGDDAEGETIIRESERAGIDMSRVARIAGAKSSSYIAVIDDRGDMLVGLSDMRLIQTMPISYLEENAPVLRGARYIICDGTLPAGILEELAKRYGEKCLVDPVSIAYAKKLVPMIGGFFCIKPNRYELETLSGISCGTDADIINAAERLLTAGTRVVLVSLGERGCFYADAEGRRFFRSVEPLTRMADATGAGDALLGAFTAALARELPTETCVDLALAAGRVAAASEHTVAPEMSEALLWETLRRFTPEK